MAKKVLVTSYDRNHWNFLLFLNATVLENVPLWLQRNIQPLTSHGKNGNTASSNKLEYCKYYHIYILNVFQSVTFHGVRIKGYLDLTKKKTRWWFDCGTIVLHIIVSCSVWTVTKCSFHLTSVMHWLISFGIECKWLSLLGHFWGIMCCFVIIHDMWYMKLCVSWTWSQVRLICKCFNSLEADIMFL